MNRRWTAEQKRAILQEAAILGNVKSTCQDNKISESQFYTWRKKFQTEGLEGLERRSRKDKGQKRNYGGWVKYPTLNDLWTVSNHEITSFRRVSNRKAQEVKNKFLVDLRLNNGVCLHGLTYYRSGGQLIPPQTFLASGLKRQLIVIPPDCDLEREVGVRIEEALPEYSEATERELNY